MSSPTNSSTPGARQSMIIIGGGLGGLSTGCYAQMNGYTTRVFEMHEIPGGSCTAWERGDFTFDWCVSWLLGSGPGNEMHQIWLELGALQGKEMRQFDVFNIVRVPGGQPVYFYSDPDRLQAHLLEISPADARRIKNFCDGVRTFQKALAVYPFLKPVGLMGRWERWRMLASFLPYFNAIRKSITELMTDYAAKFQHPVLREAFNYVLYEKHPDFPVLPFWFQLARTPTARPGCRRAVRWRWPAPSSSAICGWAGRSPTTPRWRRSSSSTTRRWGCGWTTAGSSAPTSWCRRPMCTPPR